MPETSITNTATRCFQNTKSGIAEHAGVASPTCDVVTTEDGNHRKFRGLIISPPDAGHDIRPLATRENIAHSFHQIRGFALLKVTASSIPHSPTKSHVEHRCVPSVRGAGPILKWRSRILMQFPPRISWCTRKRICIQRDSEFCLRFVLPRPSTSLVLCPAGIAAPFSRPNAYIATCSCISSSSSFWCESDSGSPDLKSIKVTRGGSSCRDNIDRARDEGAASFVFILYSVSNSFSGSKLSVASSVAYREI